MGYEQHEIQGSLRERTDNIMDTYLIVDTMKTKICGCMIKVRHWHSPDLSISLSKAGDSSIRAERQRPWNSTTQPTVKDAYSPRRPGREDHHSPRQHESKEDDHSP